jgi:hypothetical protein
MLSDGNSSPKICPFKLYKMLTEIFMHCLGSCMFVFSEKESFNIHIPIGSDIIFLSCIGSHLRFPINMVKNNQYIYRLIYMQKILDTCFLFSNNLPLINGVTSPNGEVEIKVNLENSFDHFYLTHTPWELGQFFLENAGRKFYTECMENINIKIILEIKIQNFWCWPHFDSLIHVSLKELFKIYCQTSYMIFFNEIQWKKLHSNLTWSKQINMN